MGYETALKILGLQNGFNENDLKKAHRKLANLYHPDRNQSSDAAEKMKDINQARDILAAYLKTGQKTHTKTNTHQSRYNPKDNHYQSYKQKRESYNYQKQKIEIINNKTIFNYNRYNPSKNIKNIIQKIEKYRLSFIIKVAGQNKETIDIMFEQLVNEIITVYKEIEVEFYKENYIDKEDIKEIINYDCTLTEFYEQLLKIKDKYNKKEIVKQRLESEISKYKYFAGYDKITKLIETCLKNTLIEIIQKGYKYTEKDIENMHHNIEECFQKYFLISKKISDLEPLITSIDNPKIKNYYTQLKEDFENTTNFTNIEKSISSIESLINKYQEENQTKLNFEKNKESIDKIYQSLTERYQKIINSYDEETNVDSIKILNSKLNDILRLFKKGCTEYQDISFFNLFNYITFENDRQIIKEINQQLKNKNEKVYVRRKDKTSSMHIGDDSCFFLLEEMQKKLYRIDPYEVNQIRYNENDQEELLENYISLDDLLDECIYIGEYKTTVFGEKILVLYETNGYLIYQDQNDDICIKVNSIFRLKETGETIDNTIFKDKKQMLEIIVAQNNQKVNKHKKKGFIYDATDIYNSKKSR